MINVNVVRGLPHLIAKGFNIFHGLTFLRLSNHNERLKDISPSMRPLRSLRFNLLNFPPQGTH